MTRAVLMGETEVTNDLYERLTNKRPSKFVDCGLQCPVDRVSWYDAAALANALSVSEGFEPCYVITGSGIQWPLGPACKGFRLPTEAEWEVAARGGSDLRFAGGDKVGAVGWFDTNSNASTHPVGQKAANGFGLYDMSGNLWEWVWDWYDGGAYGVGAVSDPIGPESGADRVLRGGSWANGSTGARVSRRGSGSPGDRDNSVGVRLVRTAD